MASVWGQQHYAGNRRGRRVVSNGRVSTSRQEARTGEVALITEVTVRASER